MFSIGFIFFRKSSFWLSSKPSQRLRLLGQLFLCIHVDHLKFSPKDHGRPDPRTWRASRAAAARFGSWKNGQIASNYAKSRNCCKKKARFFFRFIFVFSFFFSVVFSFLCSILVVFSRFSITNLTKSYNIQKLQKNSFFFSFVFRCFFRFFFFFELFSNKCSINFQIVFESQKQLSFYVRIIFEIKKEFVIYFQTSSIC